MNDLENALHHQVDLEAGFTTLTAEGIRSDGTVRKELLSWGDAEAVGITIDEGEVKAGRTSAVDLMILDQSGTPVRDWNGHVEVAVDGDAKLFPFTDTGEVLMARGEGRLWLRPGNSGDEIVIRAVADGIEPGFLAIRPRP